MAAIRLMLDYAANVDEAIALLLQYDMHSSMDVAHHFALSDTAGRSVVLEYIDNQMIVTPSVACTNHRLANKNGQADTTLQGAIENSNQRFEQLLAAEQNSDAVATTLEQVSFEGWTRWSIVFHPTQRQATYYFGADFTAPHVMEF